MFTNRAEDYSAFFKHGPGAMMWTFDPEGRRQLEFIPPKGRYPVRIYCDTSKEDWGQPGDIPRWNGDTEKPTFSESIQLDEWHGYIKAGIFEDADQ